MCIGPYLPCTSSKNAIQVLKPFLVATATTYKSTLLHHYYTCLKINALAGLTSLRKFAAVMPDQRINKLCGRSALFRPRAPPSNVPGGAPGQSKSIVGRYEIAVLLASFAILIRFIRYQHVEVLIGEVEPAFILSRTYLYGGEAGTSDQESEVPKLGSRQHL